MPKKNNPIDMETPAGGVPNIKGREISMDKDDKEIQKELKSQPVKKAEEPKTVTAKDEKIEITSDLPGMAAKLEYVPENIRARVAKLTQTDIAMSGMSRDPEAYAAYLQAEKTMRDLRRQREKKGMNFDGIKPLDI